MTIDDTVGAAQIVLPLDEFCDIVRAELELPDAPRPSERLMADLEFDSIRMLELVCVIEDLGAYVPDDAVATIETVEDAYMAYSTFIGTSAPGVDSFEA